MSEEAKDAKPKGNGLLLWILVPAIAAGGGFAASKVLFPATADAESHDLPLEAPDAAGSAFIPFEDVTVNLNDPRLSRYLHVQITLQIRKAEEEEFHELLDLHRSPLRTWLLAYLADLTPDDIRGRAGQQRIRRDIQTHFNSVLFSDGFDHIYDVLLEQFNVQ
jgi:flagellar basal body-associated protein FliL